MTNPSRPLGLSGLACSPIRAIRARDPPGSPRPSAPRAYPSISKHYLVPTTKLSRLYIRTHTYTWSPLDPVPPARSSTLVRSLGLPGHLLVSIVTENRGRPPPRTPSRQHPPISNRSRCLFSQLSRWQALTMAKSAPLLKAESHHGSQIPSLPPLNHRLIRYQPRPSAASAGE